MLWTGRGGNVVVLQLARHRRDARLGGNGGGPSRSCLDSSRRRLCRQRQFGNDREDDRHAVLVHPAANAASVRLDGFAIGQGHQPSRSGTSFLLAILVPVTITLEGVLIHLGHRGQEGRVGRDQIAVIANDFAQRWQKVGCEVLVGDTTAVERVADQGQ